MREIQEIEFLTLDDVLETHREMIATIGGSPGVRDLGAVESAIAQPRMTFGSEDLCPTLAEKAAAMSFSLINNHPFVDGNKRVGHAAMALFLDLNGYALVGGVDEQEKVILSVAAGTLGRAEFTDWVQAHVQPLKVSG
ncbi:MAG: type II toxin-antitoxin system death-on-curing family toxin [Armatimonadota bacterium]|nr:type II toxin-antitoxin system death-on-curing family toxin [Armatimonadota bacterium]